MAKVVAIRLLVLSKLVANPTRCCTAKGGRAAFLAAGVGKRRLQSGVPTAAAAAAKALVDAAVG